MIRQVVLVIAVTGALGQTKAPPTGEVAATVTDSVGSVIPGVAIWASSAPDLKVSCVTNIRGECTIRSLEPGRYLLEANLSGFTTERARVDVVAGETYRWNVRLVVVGGRSAIDLLDHVTKLTGPDPADCGKFRPSRPRGEASVDQIRPSLACAADAAGRRKPFLISNEHQGIDSVVIDGLLGTPDGVIYRFDFDSAPCGNPGCPSRFTTERCDHPSLVQRGEAVRFVCTAPVAPFDKETGTHF